MFQLIKFGDRMQVLITGHKGFISSKLIQAFYQDGVKVQPLILDYEKNQYYCEDFIKKNPTLIFHLGADSDRSARFDQIYAKNYLALIALKKFCFDLDLCHIVFTSAASCTPSPSKNIITGNPYHANIPNDAYSISKLFGESFIRTNIKSSTIIRVPSVYGRGYGRGIISRLHNAAISNQLIEIKNPDCLINSVIFIDDLINFFKIFYKDSLNNQEIYKKNKFFYLGSSDSLSIINIAQLLIKITMSKSSIKIYPNIIDDNKNYLLDIEAAISFGLKNYSIRDVILRFLY